MGSAAGVFLKSGVDYQLTIRSGKTQKIEIYARGMDPSDAWEKLATADGERTFPVRLKGSGILQLRAIGNSKNAADIEITNSNTHTTVARMPLDSALVFDVF